MREDHLTGFDQVFQVSLQRALRHCLERHGYVVVDAWPPALISALRTLSSRASRCQISHSITLRGSPAAYPGVAARSRPGTSANMSASKTSTLF
jgi:hypothetical protein